MKCGVCGGVEFTSNVILTSRLVHEWELSSAEEDYINRQQGETCDRCGVNLRSIALANAIRAVLGTTMLLRDLVDSPRFASLRLLEINEAGMICEMLRRLPKHRRAEYPEVDMNAMPYEDGSFDLIVHSDTLEHVPDPIHALAECRRVLEPGGALCFTVPLVVGRMSRDRAGLPPSYHGSPEPSGVYPQDYLVHTEFGADAWTYPMRAGFTDVSIHSIGFPAATACVARNGWQEFDADEANALRREVAALRNSNSWKATRGLRWMSSLLRRH